jgi:glycosyltransferase involved in cell wall biosynthesis
MNFLKRFSKTGRKLNVLFIIPDTTHQPFGGMGTQAKGLIDSCKNVNFIEHNPSSSLPFHLNSDISQGTIFGQLYGQAFNLPSKDSLKNIDIVHSFDASTSIQGRAIATHLGVPHVMTLQLSMHWLLTNIYKNNNSLFSTIELSSINMADAVIHVSKEYLNFYGPINPNSYYMPNGIDFDHWQSMPYTPVDLPGRKNAKKLCYIGRYAEMKNVEGIVGASIPEDVDMYFIGGDRAGQEERFSAMLNFVDTHPNAYYLGEKHGVDKINTLKSMDAIIVPSHHEPFGIVCLEALASGCILLSSFESGMKEYLTEDVAINCGTSIDTITKAIEYWLNIDDSETRIQKGYDLCKKYSWEKAGTALEGIYKKVLEK